MASLEKVTQTYNGATIECGHFLTSVPNTIFKLENVIGSSSETSGDYTWQMVARSNINNKTITVYIGNKSYTFTLSTSFKKYSHIFYGVDTTQSSDVKLDFSNGQFWLYHVQLEHGNVVTDWHPNTDDVVEEADEKLVTLYESRFEATDEAIAANARAITLNSGNIDDVREETNSKFEVQAGRITAVSESVTNLATSTSNSISELQQTDQGLTSKIGNVTTFLGGETYISSSSLEQTAAQIASTVVEGELTDYTHKSELRQTAENILLSVSENYDHKANRNLIVNTGDFSGYGLSDTITIIDTDEGVNAAHWSSVATAAFRYLNCFPPILYSNLRNKIVTFSMDIRSSDYARLNSTQYKYFVAFALCSGTSTARTKYGYAIAESSAPSVSNEWTRISATINVSDSFFSNGSGQIAADTRFYIQVCNHSLYSLEVKKIKLEFDSENTPWIRAVEDYVFDSAFTGENIVSKINLTSTTATIEAQHVNLNGAVTINSLSEEAQQTLLNNSQSQNQYYLSTSSTEPVGGEWVNSQSNLQWESGKYVWTRIATTTTSVSGIDNTTYSTAIYDRNLTEALMAAAKASNIVIGGTQLLPDTNVNTLTKVDGSVNRYWSDSSKSSYARGSFVEISDPPVSGIKYGVRLECFSTSTGLRGYAWLNEPMLNMVDGETYTMSCYCRLISGDSADVCMRYAYEGMSSQYENYRNFTSKEWTRLTQTFVFDADATGEAVVSTNQIRPYPINIRLNKIAIIEACGFKIERGTIATDWTDIPAHTETIANETATSVFNGAIDGAVNSRIANVVVSTVSCYYRQSPGTSTAPTINSSTTIATTDISNQWTYVMPSPASGCNFWTCEKYTYKDGSVGFSVVRQLPTVSAVSAWCSANNSTKIDGANIYTGSITSDALQANSVTAGKIEAGSVTADKISVDDLSALGATIGGWSINSTQIYSEGDGFKTWLANGTWNTKDVLVVRKTIDAESELYSYPVIIRSDGSAYFDSINIRGGDIHIETDSEKFDTIVLNYQYLDEQDHHPTGSIAQIALCPERLELKDTQQNLSSATYCNGFVVRDGNNDLQLQLGYYRSSGGVDIPELYFNQGNGLIEGVKTIKYSGGGTINYNGSSFIFYPAVSNLSDSRTKNIKANLSEKTSTALLSELKPKIYEYKNFAGICHYGLIAQDVLESCNQIGVNASGIIDKFINPDDESGTEYYTLNYLDLIAFLIKGWQKHEKEIADLKNNIK